MTKSKKNIIDSKKSIYEEDYDKLIKLGNELQEFYVTYCNSETDLKKKDNRYGKNFL